MNVTLESNNNKNTTTDDARDILRDESEKNATNTTSNNTTSGGHSERIVPETKLAVSHYEILGASPSDTRSELKRKYVALAKQTHPDAVRQTQETNTNITTAPLDFQDIANAYRILSNPKLKRRYDRQVRADQLSLELQTFATGFGDTVGPQLETLLDQVALPFLRRTTATTLASMQAAARDWSAPDNNQDLGHVFQSAVQAARNAGDIMDDMERQEQGEALLEQSGKLEQQLLEQQAAAEEVQAQLESARIQRLRAALRVDPTNHNDTPTSNLSMDDATSLVQYWNQTIQTQTTSLSEQQRTAFAKKLIAQLQPKIENLQSAEDALQDSDLDLGSLVLEYKETELKLQQARANKVLAVQAEQRAREALKEAQRQVTESHAQVHEASKSLTQTEGALERKSRERDGLAKKYAKQQTHIVAVLRKKDQVVCNKLELSKDTTEEEESLEILQNKEQELLREYEQLKVTANQLQAQAKQLKQQAQQIKDTQ